MKSSLIWSLVIMVLATSCRSGKLQKKAVEIGKENSEVAFNPKELEFSQLRMKSEVDLKSSFLNQKFPIVFQIQKDSLIWASVSVGIEIGRAKITRDSLMFMDRFNRKAYLGTWADLKATTGFELNYSILQSILVGNMVYAIESGDELESSGGISTLSQKRGGMDFVTKADNSVQKVFEVKGKDPASSTELAIGFKGFVTESNQLLPTIIEMILTDKAQMTVRHSTVEFSNGGLNFAFSVPSSYKKERLP